MAKIIKNLQFLIGTTIGLYPQFFWIRYYRKNLQRKLIYSDSTICIEGFQRSGNSFLVSIFRHWNHMDNPKIADHVHAPMQIIKALKYNIPTALLIREPLETIASLIIMDEKLDTDLAVKSYIRFYKRLKPYKNEIVVSPFETTINQPEKVFQMINEKFGSQFRWHPYDKTKLNRLLNRLDNLKKDRMHSPLPNESKEERKKLVREKIKKSKHFPQAKELFLYFVE